MRQVQLQKGHGKAKSPSKDKLQGGSRAKSRKDPRQNDPKRRKPPDHAAAPVLALRDVGDIAVQPRRPTDVRQRYRQDKDKTDQTQGHGAILARTPQGTWFFATGQVAGAAQAYVGQIIRTCRPKRQRLCLKPFHLSPNIPAGGTAEPVGRRPEARQKACAPALHSTAAPTRPDAKASHRRPPQPQPLRGEGLGLGGCRRNP